MEKTALIEENPLNDMRIFNPRTRQTPRGNRPDHTNEEKEKGPRKRRESIFD